MCVRAQSIQSCPALCHPMDQSLPSSSFHGILQARILEWLAKGLNPHFLCLLHCRWTLYLVNYLGSPVNGIVLGKKSFPGSSMTKNLLVNAGDVDLISGSGKFPGERNGNPLQYSCLGNPTDREAWRATVHRVAKDSDTTYRLNNCTTTTKKWGLEFWIYNLLNVLLWINYLTFLSFHFFTYKNRIV